MEVGSEVYSMALALQLQKIVGSPLTQELRLAPVVAAPESSWSSSSSRLLGHHENASSDVMRISNGISREISSSTSPSIFQPFVFADYDFASRTNASLDLHGHANFSEFPFLPSSSSSVAASSANVHDLGLYYRHSFTMNVVYCVAYCIVFIVGLIGNSFVIAVVLRAPRMRTVTNYFIVNLAIADILVIVFCLPATLMSNVFVRKWILFFRRLLGQHLNLSN